MHITLRIPLSLLAFILAASFLTAPPAEAATCTSAFDSSKAIPTGYGAAYSLFTNAKERLVQGQSCTRTSLTLKAGSGGAPQYVYKQGHIWTGTKSQQYTLATSTGELMNDSWYTKDTSTHLVSSGATSYVVGYSCQQANGAWKCGCHDIACATSARQLQQIIIADDTGGGESAGSGVSFREFSGVCQSDTTGNELFSKALSWNRIDFFWADYEPSEGQYNKQYLQQYGQLVLDMKEQGGHLLPIFAYNTSWSSIDGNGTSPLAAEHVDDWERMVDRVVKYLMAEPYNVEYFQIWNEAHPDSGFWHGHLDTYMQRVHLPAAKVIRANGGKVVYGGWPAVGRLTEFINLLDKHNAWSTMDVIAIHYRHSPGDFQILYDAAKSRGYPNMGLWETEFGFNTDEGFIADKYPRFLSWALNHDWSYPHKYKLFWFANDSPNDPSAYGYNSSLYSGSSLSHHGRWLQTMGDLFDRTGLKSHSVTVSKGEAEGFAMNGRIVVAVHIDPGSASSVQLSLRRPSTTAVKVQRVDIAGVRQDITSQLMSSGQSLVVNASTMDSSGPALSWNKSLKRSSASFFVVFELAQ